MKFAYKIVAVFLFCAAAQSYSQTRDIVRYFDECARTCSRECYSYGDLISSHIEGFYRSCGGQHQPPPPPTGLAVEIYNNDHCSGELVAIFNTNGSCTQLPNDRVSAWAVKTNGTCLDIQDTTAMAACQQLQGLGDSQAVEIYHNDHCEKDLVASVTPFMSCDDLPDNATIAWAIKTREGTCKDISDTTPKQACLLFAR